MTTNTRLIPGVFLALLAVTSPILAQSEPSTSPASRPLSEIVPSVAPPWQKEEAVAPAQYTTAVDRVTDGAPATVPQNAPQAGQPAPWSNPYGTLTGQPLPQSAAPGLQKGAYPSPYYTDGPGCCGPLGRNGRIGYEVYAYTGPSWALGEGAVARRLNTGWMVGGGGRSLLFNTTHDAAWVFDLGVSYQYNRGSVENPLIVDIRQPDIQGPNNTSIPQPDLRVPGFVQGIHRTNFNFALGRDWWRWGPGTVGMEQGWNMRWGGLVGGRWGTGHADIIPADPVVGTYQRRQGVIHGLFLATHATAELPLGSVILFTGFRFEWGYDWMNFIPPQEGNLHNLNLLLTGGIRF